MRPKKVENLAAFREVKRIAVEVRERKEYSSLETQRGKVVQRGAREGQREEITGDVRGGATTIGAMEKGEDVRIIEGKEIQREFRRG